jgi:hypothetical protein
MLTSALASRFSQVCLGEVVDDYFRCSSFKHSMPLLKPGSPDCKSYLISLSGISASLRRGRQAGRQAGSISTRKEICAIDCSGGRRSLRRSCANQLIKETCGGKCLFSLPLFFFFSKSLNLRKIIGFFVQNALAYTTTCLFWHALNARLRSTSN